VEPQNTVGPEARPVRQTAARRRCAMRMVNDPHQGMVLVYEIVGPASDHEPPTLIFEWGQSSVRLTAYPDAWRTLRDAELLALRVS
jgi:hypothetical protein